MNDRDRLIDIALSQVADAMKIADHLGTIIPKVAALEAENRRLRKIEEAARAMLAAWDAAEDFDEGEWEAIDTALRAALEATDERP